MTAVRQPPLRLPVESDLPGPRLTLVWAPWLLLALMMLAFAAVFSWLSVARHLAYQSHAFDLGNMDQAVWSTLHGHLLRFTDMEAGHAVLTSRLAIHVEPLLVPLSALYLVHDGPETLLAVQALVVASGAVPAYLLSRALLGRPWLSLVFPAAYLLHPSLQNALLDDFHAVTLSASFLLWATYFALRGRMPWFAVSALLAAATKEEVGLAVAVIGILLLARGHRLAGASTIASGVGWFLVCVLVIIPHFNPGGGSPYLARYEYLGHGLAGILAGALRHPHLVVSTLTSNTRLVYLDTLFHPLGFTSLLGLPLLAPALPSLAINMLSADPTMWSGYYQYSAEVVPFAVAAAIAGVAAAAAAARRVRGRRVDAVPAALCLLALVASVVDARLGGFSPMAEGYVVPAAGPHQAVENAALRLVPPTAVVAAADEIEPHLSHRQWIYLLPTVHPRNGPAAQYIVLDASIPSLPIRPGTLHAVAVQAVRHGYGVVSAQDGVLVLRRGLRQPRLSRSFYSFVFRADPSMKRLRASWGPLALVGLTVHPKSLTVDRARPAVEVETYWRTYRRLPAASRIVFYLSPVYSGAPPAYSPRWTEESDNPTADWLPYDAWPAARTIHVASLPLLPDVYAHGNVDVAVGVWGTGHGPSLPAGRRIRGASHLFRLATISVGG